MAEKPLPPAAGPPVRRSSGEHESVKEFRRKLDSIADDDEVQVELASALNKLDKIAEKDRTSRPPPPSDPRREPETDPRVEQAIPTDIVGVSDDPFPSKRPGSKT